MIDFELEKRVRAAARASVDAVAVPEPPASLRLLRPSTARRRPSGWLWAAAAAAAVTLTVATDSGRAAIAYAVEHTMQVFSVDPDSGKRVPVSTISLQEAMSTTAFPVVMPRGLPSGARLLSIQRMGDPETGRPAVVFHYALGARPFDILESALPRRDGATNQTVQGASSTMSESRTANAKVVGPAVAFHTGRTQVIVSFAHRALADAQIAALRAAMTVSPDRER